MSNVENQIHHYSFALYSLYEDIGESFIKDLNILFSSLYSNKEMIIILSSNNISKTERKIIISSIFGNDINKFVINFLFILIENNFFHQVLYILQDLFKYYNNQNNIAFIKILSPFELKKEDTIQIVSILKQKLKKEIIYKVKIKKSLIGGIKIIYNDENILDYSIKGKINKMKFDILKNKRD